MELTIYCPNYLKADFTCRKTGIFCSVKLIENHGVLKIIKKVTKFEIQFGGFFEIRKHSLKHPSIIVRV